VRGFVGLVLSLSVAAIFTSSLAAQSPLGTVRGLVRDASESPLAGAAVQLVDAETEHVRQAVTGPGGEFAIPLVPPGRYRLVVETEGFRTHVQPLVVNVNQEVRVSIALQLGPLSEQVVVAAPATEIRQGSAAVGTVIDNQQISDLPLDGRNFLELALLVAGAAPAAQGSASSARGDFAFTVNGGREDANGFLLDGADNVDPKLNTPAVRPPVDAIREFEVLTSTYEAAFGRYAGGQVNVALKSGSNDVHGSAYEFVRAGALGARNFFAPDGEPAPDYERHQFGLSVGGPLRRSRTFFFADYEGSRPREGITRVTNVPTAAERAGDFSRSLLPAPIDPFTGRPFPGGVIPAFRLHPVGAAIAALYPLPNRDRPFQNHVSSPVQRDDNDHFDARVTHTLGAGADLSVRYSLGDRRLFEPFAGGSFSALPGFGNDVPRRGQHLAVGQTSVISPSLLNEVRFAWARVSIEVLPQVLAGQTNAAVGLPSIWTDPRDEGLSFVTVTGFSALGSEYNNPQQSATNAWQIADTLTWTAGAHLAKVGFDIRGVGQRGFRDVQARGFLTFSGQAGLSGNALADLLLGLPLFTGAASLDNPQHLRTASYGVFAQDSWRANESLTVSAGLRYEYMSPPTDPDDRASLYDPETGGLARVGTHGLPRGGYDPDRNNIAPRVGVAWTVPGRPDLVLRGGYGIYYGQSALAPSEGLYFSPPYYDLSLFFPLPGLPLTLSDPFPASFPIAWPDSALAYQRDLSTPFLHQWSVTVQKQVGRRGTAEVGYVASRGRNLVRGRDMNQAAPSPLPFNPRPDPRFGDITIIESGARSRYDSFQARYQQRQAFGLSLLASYAWSESRDDASGFFPSAGDANFPQDSNDPGAEWGRSSFDVRHRLSLGFAYELPFGAGATGAWRALASDWQLSGIVTLQSGRPFTVALLPELDNSNTGRSSLGFGSNDRPDQVGDPRLDDPSADRWFDTRAFALPPYGSFGEVGRNTLEGPGYANVNLAVLKQVALARGARLQVRVEAFNLFNRTNLGQPDNFFGSPTFGQVLSADSSRRVQFGAKLVF
jgi:hypothetical protein